MRLSYPCSYPLTHPFHSEFDLIEKDFRIYRAFSGPSFRVRVERLKSIDFTWGIRVTDGVVSREGQIASHNRAKGVEALTKKYAKELPDMVMWYNGHDSPKINVGWDERVRLDRLVEAGECAPPPFPLS